MPTTCAVRPAVRTADPVAGRTDVPVAASTAVLPLLEGATTGTVLARFPAAVYVRLGTGAVVAVVTSDGLRLPNALVVAATTRQAPFPGHRRHTAARVVDRALEVDGVRYRPVRTWTPRTSTTGVLRPEAVDELAARLAPSPHSGTVGVRLTRGTAALARALRTGRGLAPAVEGLLGLGPGLTPAGDDVLAGVLLTHVHLGHVHLGHVHPGAGRHALDAAVRRRAGATTALSADLLHHAGQGRAAPPVLGLLDALVGARPLAPALAGLLAVGSSSGHDTATGVLLAASGLLDRPEDA